MRLFCISRYRSSLGSYRDGDEIDVDDETADLLQRDSPGSFSLTAPKEKTPKPSKSNANKKPAKEPEEPTIDPAAATLDELKAFADAQGIELEDDASDEDIRAAVQLALEEHAKAKLETEQAAGTTTTTRPQRKGNSR